MNMRRKRATTCLIFACFLLLLDIAHVDAADMQERTALVDEVRFLVSRKDYPALEKLHSTFMDPSARLPSGTWKLAFFYYALEESLLRDPDSEYWKTKEEAALGWRKNFPNSTAAQIYLAYVYLRHAWTVRGLEFASEVRAWPQVVEYAAKAHAVLQEGGAAPRADPGWYAAMISVLRLHRGEPAEFEKVLEEGMAAHPAYHDLYFQASFSLLPKWGGSKEAVEQLALTATSRSARTEGRAMYARVYWYQSQAEYKGELFDESRADWPRMKAGFEDIVSRYPDPWNINSYAYFACLAGDKGTLQSLLRRIGNSVIHAAWGQNQSRFYNDCVAFAH